jgi:hypothetical protein
MYFFVSPVVCLPLDPRVVGSNLAEAMDFESDKNKQQTFLPMESKTAGPTS